MNNQVCPNCGTIINNSNVCPNCGTVVQANYTAPRMNYTYAYPTQYSAVNKSDGTAALVIAIIVSILSVIAAFIVVCVLAIYNIVNSTDIQMPGDILDDVIIFDENTKSNDYFVSDNSPFTFNDQLYSFSNGDIDTEYNLTFKESYRGDAAVKLLDGAVLPEISSLQEFYVVRFELNIINQTEDAFVIFPFTPLAYDSKSIPIPPLNLSYQNTDLLFEKDCPADLWCAYVINKNGESPKIRWKVNDVNVYFENSMADETEASKVIQGNAVKVK